MDIEEFYDADERRRSSDEVELGRDWHDAVGVRYELSWVVDTGELYVMREPVPGGTWVDPFGEFVRAGDVPTESVVVHVLARLPDRAEIDRVFDGWQQAMPGTNSLGWVIERLHAARQAGHDVVRAESG